MSNLVGLFLISLTLLSTAWARSCASEARPCASEARAFASEAKAFASSEVFLTYVHECVCHVFDMTLKVPWVKKQKKWRSRAKALRRSSHANALTHIVSHTRTPLRTSLWQSRPIRNQHALPASSARASSWFPRCRLYFSVLGFWPHPPAAYVPVLV